MVIQEMGPFQKVIEPRLFGAAEEDLETMTE
jgi:hypothetical protein